MNNVRITVIAVLLLGFATVSFGQKQSADDAAIRMAVGRLVTAQMGFDQKTLEELLAADYVEVSPIGEPDDRAKVISFYSPEAKAKSSSSPIVVDTTEETIRNYGTFAITSTKLTYTLKLPDGRSANRVLRGVYVLRKIKGTWQFSSAQYTTMRPPKAEKPKG